MTGFQLYEKDLKRCPRYDDGPLRKSWLELPKSSQKYWDEIAAREGEKK